MLELLAMIITFHVGFNIQENHLILNRYGPINGPWFTPLIP